MSDPNAQTTVAAGWYDDGSGRKRWWDGTTWTDHFEPQTTTTATTPAGWYDDGSGRQRWWDGSQWTNNFAPVAAPPQPQQQWHSHGPMTHGALNVKREVSYVRPQKGHSIVLHVFLGFFILFINVIYISVSPNHYWHT